MKRSYLFLPLLLLMTFILSCDKDNFSPTDEQDDFNLENFLSDSYFSTYNTHYNPLPLLESRSSQLMTQTVKDYFAKNPKEAKQVEAKYGMPIWDKAFNMNGENGQFLKIPITKRNSKSVETIMYVGIDLYGKVQYQIYEKKSLKNFKKPNKIKKNQEGYFLELSQDYLASNLIYFDHITFQNIDCSLKEFIDDGSNIDLNSLEERSCIGVKVETDWYQITSAGGNTYYSSLEPTYQYYWICSADPVSGGTYIPPLPDYQPQQGGQYQPPPSGVENKMVNSINNCLWEKWMNSNLSLFNKYIKPFSSSVTKLVVSDNAYSGGRGYTGYAGDKWISININSAYFKDKCNILKSSTMIHESIHAGILRLQRSNESWNDYPGLKSAHDTYGTEWNHDYMANNLVSEMASNLKSLHPGFSEKEYLAIIWNGLSFTSEYKEIPENLRKEYQSIYNSFYNNTKSCTKSCQ